MFIIKKFILILVLSVLYSQDIGFVGNSTTHNQYPKYTGNILVGYKIINYAVTGIAVIRNGFEYKNTQEFIDILTRRPEYTIMLLGSCDHWQYQANKDLWQTEYTYLVNSLSNNSVLMLGTIPFRLFEADSDAPIREMNNVIRSIAAGKGLQIIDFNAKLGRNTNLFFNDGIHPNEEGQRKMAEIAAQAIVQHRNLSNPGDHTPPEIPKNFTVSCGDKQVTLFWDANTENDLCKYFLFRDTTEDGMGIGLKTLNCNFTCYTDTTVENDITYYYRIAAGDSSDNRSKKSDAVCATPTFLKLVVNLNKIECCLLQNHPNPFNPSTTIDYSISYDSDVNISIYDLSGNTIQTIVNEYKPIGDYSITWDGTDSNGNSVSNGTYIYQIKAGNFTQTKKMVLLK